MSEALGLSIGVANLVAARVRAAPVARSSVLTLFDQRAAEVSVPEENPNLTEPGIVLRGFVDRVGNQTPLVSADGTKYLGNDLTARALDALARTVGSGAPVTIAVPAYWSQGQVAALRNALASHPHMTSNGAPPALVSDTTAAVATLSSNPRFPTDGVVVLVDLGDSGTSITLTDASSNYQPIHPTVRSRQFSGAAIDQLILKHVLSAAPRVDAANLSDTATGMGPMTHLVGGCRRAKEQLSAATITTIPTAVTRSPSSDLDLRLSRSEFDQLITGPLEQFIAEIEEALQRNKIQQNHLAAVATVGGGASIPLITARLSERLRVPIFTTAQPMLSAAIGAAVLGQEGWAAAAATGAGQAVDEPTNIVGAAVPPTEVSPSAWANQAANAAAGESGSENVKSATYRALAWSQETGGDEPVPYTGVDGTGDYGRDATTKGYEADVDPRYDTTNEDQSPEKPEPVPWYKPWAAAVGLVAAGTGVLIAVVLGLKLGSNDNAPTDTTSSTQSTPSPTSEIATVTEPSNSQTPTVLPPPPITSTAQPPVTTTTTQLPTTPSSTTTTTASPPTSTTTQPTTSMPTTSSQVTTTPPTSSPTAPTTTTAPVTPTTAAPGA
ncbi:Hsp70 family protein [Mycobacterium sp.]|uniref:Hsp70 family protein n=1 Tax=Mycobacterium sp. TaxID=1785 RepID=UPI003BAADB0C